MKKERLFNIILIAVVSLFVLSFIIIPLADKSSHVYIVTSGSMEPSLNVGDIVYVKDCSASEVNIGDVINFHRENEKYTVTHRCVSIIEKGNETFFKTKGDANEESDIALVSESELVGKVPYANIFGHTIYAKIPRLGYLSYFVHTRTGFLLFVLVPGFALIGIESYNIFNIVQGSANQKNGRLATRKILEHDIDKNSLKMIVCPYCGGIFYYEDVMKDMEEIKCVHCNRMVKINA